MMRSIPQQERPREKLLSKGAAFLSDSELLAIFIRTGVKGQSALDIARKLLNQFGSLKALFHAPKEAIYKVSGLGPVKYAELLAILEINRRYLFEAIKKRAYFHNTSATKRYLLAQFSQYHREVFACLFLDKKYQLIDFKELFFGAIDRTEIYPGEVVKMALHYHSSAIILAHNHPSGDPTPSHDDIAVTKQLKKALELVDISLLDHLVIGENKIYSIAEMQDV